MDLQRNSVEYAHVTFSNLPDNATIEASVDRKNWTAATVINGEALVLLAGPDAPSVQGALPVNIDTELWLRITANPEIIVRSAGQIDLY